MVTPLIKKLRKEQCENCISWRKDRSQKFGCRNPDTETEPHHPICSVWTPKDPSKPRLH